MTVSRSGTFVYLTVMLLFLGLLVGYGMLGLLAGLSMSALMASRRGATEPIATGAHHNAPGT